MVSPGIFKAYDIRGIVGRTLTPEIVRTIGQALGSLAHDRKRDTIVVGAHYDTEYHPKGFVGANDGAAGTAAVVELARALRSTSGREVRFVLFDGEEEGPGCSNARFAECALRGSRAYVAAHRGEVGQMVLLDYVANKGLRLPREGGGSRRSLRPARSSGPWRAGAPCITLPGRPGMASAWPTSPVTRFGWSPATGPRTTWCAATRRPSRPPGVPVGATSSPTPLRVVGSRR